MQLKIEDEDDGEDEDERLSHSTLTSNSRLKSIGDGLVSPWFGLRHMGRHPGLWKHAIMPVVLNVLISAVVLAGFLIASVTLAMWLHPKFSDTWWGWIGELITVLGLILATAGGAAAAWVLLRGILCGYFNAQLARHVELQLGMNPQEMRDISFTQQAADAVRNTFFLLAVNAGFLVLNCVPGVGSIVAVCGAVYFDCWVFGRELFDFPLGLRGMRRQDQVTFCRGHRWEVLGLGASVFLMNFVPIIGAVVQTTAVTGAVLLHRRLIGLSDKAQGTTLNS